MYFRSYRRYKLHDIDWGIINLINKPIFNCGCKQRKNLMIFVAKAGFDKDQTYYKQHAKSSDFIIPTKELTDAALKRAKLSELKDMLLDLN